MGVRALAGRLLEDADRLTGEAVVVNVTSSQRYFGGNAVGQTLQIGGKSPRYLRIVGVVPNLRHSGPQGRVEPEMYVLPDPRALPNTSMQLAMVMRLRPGMHLSIERLKAAAESMGPRVLVGDIKPAAALLSQQIMKPRHRMLLLTLLGVFGLLLTLVGIFSMTAYAVARRTREIGVRVAFGARPAQVVAVIIADAVWPVAFGLASGSGRRILRGAYHHELPVRDHPARCNNAHPRRRDARRRGNPRRLVTGSARCVGRSRGGFADTE